MFFQGDLFHDAGCLSLPVASSGLQPIRVQVLPKETFNGLKTGRRFVGDLFQLPLRSVPDGHVL